jgi:hypothetical protein
MYSSEMLVPSLKITWCHEPDDYNIYVGKTVLESPSEIRAKTSAYQMSCMTVGKVLCHGCPNIDDRRDTKKMLLVDLGSEDMMVCQKSSKGQP